MSVDPVDLWLAGAVAGVMSASPKISDIVPVIDSDGPTNTFDANVTMAGSHSFRVRITVQSFSRKPLG